MFTLNAEAHPKSANVHDSLGEALVAAGDTTAAIREYETAQRLDPLFSGVAEKLRGLEGGRRRRRRRKRTERTETTERTERKNEVARREHAHCRTSPSFSALLPPLSALSALSQMPPARSEPARAPPPP